MKIAINAAHGGFGLSTEAIKLYFEKIDMPCYFFEVSSKNENGKYKTVYTPVDDPNAKLHCMIFTIPDPSADPNNLNKYYFSDRFRDDRANKYLIQTIEELGSEAASGPFAKLKIVEVPDDIKWHIAEYDGWEWVAEDHRTWE